MLEPSRLNPASPFTPLQWTNGVWWTITFYINYLFNYDLKYITKTFLIQGKKCVTVVKNLGLLWWGHVTYPWLWCMWSPIPITMALFFHFLPWHTIPPPLSLNETRGQSLNQTENLFFRPYVLYWNIAFQPPNCILSNLKKGIRQ